MSAAGADSQSQRMEVLSHNMANVDTPGFKEELALLQARDSRAIRDGTDVSGRGGINDLGSGASMVETMTNFAEGTMKQTAAPWDMAIRGDGFFVVDNEGQQFLTRAGNFQVNAEGILTTQQGYRVLSASGMPIQINPSMYSVLHKDGYLEHSGAGDQLALVKPSSMGDLARAGDNLFRPLGPTQAVEPSERHVESGFLEISGVRPTRTMMELIETSRMYEANVRMIQNHDQTTGSLINRILRVR
jgi:flagellar basal-body rod protein FlgF/flagellar basal-body rod protein FlgG